MDKLENTQLLQPLKSFYKPNVQEVNDSEVGNNNDKDSRVISFRKRFYNNQESRVGKFF